MPEPAAQKESKQKQDAGTASPAQESQAVTIDDSAVSASYANFCRVTGSPEELIIDFGLSEQPQVTPRQPTVVSQRLVLNWYTAKRLLAVLSVSVQRHESVFGVLETDIRRRTHDRQKVRFDLDESLPPGFAERLLSALQNEVERRGGMISYADTKTMTSTARQ